MGGVKAEAGCTTTPGECPQERRQKGKGFVLAPSLLGKDSERQMRSSLKIN